MLRVALLAALGGSSLAEDACGKQCTSDEDCTGCGQAGKCSSPASSTKYPSIAASCVDVPAGPADPKPSVTDSRWPERFTAAARTWTYGDWSSKAAVAKGKFYYDGPGGHTRSDWHPFTDGRDGMQVWISGSGSEKSVYYVKSGPICLYFTITDPGVGGKVGIEYADWMKRCQDQGMAKYSGREKVDGEWADHYSCIIDYAKVNQTIVFQNWHSLGLGSTPKGFPLRVTGGNSAPDSKKGSPRLSTVWYSNFTVGDSAVKSDDFVKPSWFCIPVGEQEVAEFLGLDKLTPAHLGQPEHQRRAHYLPHAKPAASDLARARRPRPRAEVAGATFEEAMAKLNKMLTADRGLTTKACSAFTLKELHGLQEELFTARSPELQGMYDGDRRSLPYKSNAHLADVHSKQLSWAENRPHLTEMLRDGLCHELVMMYMHHLSASARKEIKAAALALPLLPLGGLHAPPAARDETTEAAHASYTGQTSCAICHVVPKAANLTSIVV